MDMKEEFNEAVNASITIDFEESTARCQVNFFESTIRYLGGLLGAYDLSGDARLLPKLVELGELLYSAFNTANGMSWALSDSAYEYLVKTHLLLGGITDQYAQMWKPAAVPIRQHLLFRAYIPQGTENDVLFSGIATKSHADIKPLLEPRTEHLACFAGGMFAMASRMFDEPEDLVTGKALTEGCTWAYQNSPLGIMPETVTLLECPDPYGAQCEWDDAIWEQARDKSKHYPPGYVTSKDPHYGLRPEAIESVLVLYRITGDPKWRDIGWTMFAKIIEHARTQYGHASLATVMELREQNRYEGNKEVKKMAASQQDTMESFWLAETLKYFYLLFSDPRLISLDDFVFNTEAHPFRLERGSRGFHRS
ncbi:hypothetical protein PMZ80_003979 [Knufia obscura]|uniref:alpha-1,2-Mannosidase n=1 Tax=Knufia obscura TaxID=1635080 RepID=A0ABR0RQR9_9EURO|nr:hypothetical protein PMZ80_003979 [Knufia obscura]